MNCKSSLILHDRCDPIFSRHKNVLKGAFKFELSFRLKARILVELRVPSGSSFHSRITDGIQDYSRIGNSYEWYVNVLYSVTGKLKYRRHLGVLEKISIRDRDHSAF